MREANKRVRLELAFSGLRYMLETSKSLSRGDIFNIERVSFDASALPLAVKEITIKTWQSSFLERMVKHNLFVRDEDRSNKLVGFIHANKFKIKDRNRCNIILNDYKSNGLMLAYYLFPAEVPKPNFDDETDNEIDVNDSALAVVQSPVEEAPKELELPDLLSLILSNLIEMKNHYATASQIQSEILNKLNELSQAKPNLKEDISLKELVLALDRNSKETQQLHQFALEKIAGSNV